MTIFEPRIIGFLCNWCSYAGADLAGVSRTQYPPNIRIIRTMCSGRVEPSMVLDLLTKGADGVMVTGCHIGDCHYLDGNIQARRKFALTRRLLAKTGLELERIRLEWVSAAEGQRFAQLVKDFTEQVRSLGRSPLSGESPDRRLLTNLIAAKRASEEFRLRALVAKEEKLVNEGNVYGKRFEQDEFDEEIEVAVQEEYDRERIRLALLEEPASIKKLSEKIGIEPRKILNHIVALRQRGWVEMKRIEGSSPIYAVLEVPE